ncbi:unnamed protein product [Ectocarpus sp. 13 AM-2016]
MNEVDAPLKKMFHDEARRPAVLFYDLACRYRRHLLVRGDQFFVATFLIVDRFHFRAHRELDCAEFNSPNQQDNPFSWSMDNNNRPSFHINSSMAESNNAWLADTGTTHSS